MCITACAKDPAELLLASMKCSEDPRKLWCQSCLDFAETDHCPLKTLETLEAGAQQEAAVADTERLIDSLVSDPSLGVLAHGAFGKKRKSSQPNGNAGSTIGRGKS